MYDRRVVVAIATLVLLGAGCSSSHYAKEGAPERRPMERSPLADAKETLRESGFGIDRQVEDGEGRPVTDEEVARLLDWRVALPAHARLAVLEAQAYREYFISGCFGEPDVIVEGSDWSARPAPPEDVSTIRDELGTHGRFESVSTVPAIFLPARADLGRCRYAAARTNADLILLYAKATRVVRYHNKLANFYPLILGLLLPGEETVVVTRVEAALVDVRTARVFAVAQGQCRGEDASSPFAASDEGRRVLL